MKPARAPAWKRIAIIATVALALSMTLGGFLGPRMRYVCSFVMMLSGVVLVLCLALKPEDPVPPRDGQG